jgi:alpha-tubulin suppressor-like RCC1 family protein
VAVSAGYDHTCTVLDNASLHCWGNNGNGQLGIGDTTGYPLQTTPAWVDIGTGHHMDLSERDIDGDGILNIFDTHMPGAQGDLIHVDATLGMGAAHECVLLNTGSVACWGNGY